MGFTRTWAGVASSLGLVGLGACKTPVRQTSQAQSIQTTTSSGSYFHFVEGDKAFRFFCAAGVAARAVEEVKSACEAAGSLPTKELDQKVTAAYLKKVGIENATGDLDAQLGSFETDLKKRIFECLKDANPCDPLKGVAGQERIVGGHLMAWLTGIMDRVFDDGAGASKPDGARPRGLSANLGTEQRGDAILQVLARVKLAGPSADGENLILPLSAPSDVSLLTYWVNEGCSLTVSGVNWVALQDGEILQGPDQVAYASPTSAVLNGGKGAGVRPASASIAVAGDGKGGECELTVAGYELTAEAAASTRDAGDGATRLALADGPFVMGFNFQAQTTANGVMLRITTLTPGGLASSLGFQIGDLISSIDGIVIDSDGKYDDTVAQLRQTRTSMNVKVFRGAQPRIINVPFGDAGGSGNGGSGGNGGGNGGGLIVPTGSFKMGFNFQAQSTASGTMLRVTTVTPGGRAAQAGFQIGDLIQSVDGIVMDSEAKWDSTIPQLRASRPSMSVRVVRNGSATTLSVPFDGGGNNGGGNGGGGNGGGGNGGGGAVCSSGQSRDQVMRAFMTTPQHRAWHHLWHGIRNAWDRSLSTSEKQEIVNALGSAWSRTPTDDDIGEEFLQMHHVMLGIVSRHLASQGCTMYEPWSSPPGNNDGEFVVYAPSGAAQLAQWHQQATSPSISSMTLGKYGEWVEQGLHNTMHTRHSNPATAVAAFNSLPSYFNLPTSPSHQLNQPGQDYLGHPYSSHVNPYFWRLHGYIEARLQQWLQAKGFSGIMGENGCNDASSCYRWRRPWAGAIPGGGFGLAEDGEHSEHQVRLEDLAKISPQTMRAIALHSHMFPASNVGNLQ